jgi:hypothetical protein
MQREDTDALSPAELRDAARRLRMMASMDWWPEGATQGYTKRAEELEALADQKERLV